MDSRETKVELEDDMILSIKSLKVVTEQTAPDVGREREDKCRASSRMRQLRILQKDEGTNRRGRRMWQLRDSRQRKGKIEDDRHSDRHGQVVGYKKDRRQDL